MDLADIDRPADRAYDAAVNDERGGLCATDMILRGTIPAKTRARPAAPPAAASRLARAVDGERIDRDGKIPDDLIARLRREGAFGWNLPRRHGGGGLGPPRYHAAIAAVAERSLALAMRLTTHQSLGAAALVCAFGTEAQKAELLTRMAAGEETALAVSEEGPGADPAAATARARRDGGDYVLTGRKMWVSGALSARWLAVLAQAPGGPAMFVVDARAPGIRLEPIAFMGLRGLGNALVIFDRARVPSSRRVGAEGSGARLALAVVGRGRLTIVARALGLARAAKSHAEAWTRERGISRRPAISARLARISRIVARLAALDAAAAAGLSGRADSAAAKLYAGRAAWEAADALVQLRGSRGYETAASQRARGELPVPAERLLRDARGLRLAEGAEDLMRAFLARRGLELARATRRGKKSPGPLGERAAALAEGFERLSRGRGVWPRALELADEAVEILAEAV